MNAWCNILKFIFLRRHTLVLEKGLLFQNLTRVMQFIVKHVSLLDRKPFHCQIHMDRKFHFPGCRDSRQVSTTRTQNPEQLFLLGALVNIPLSKPFRVTEIHHSTIYIQNMFSWGLYLVEQPGTMERTWFHAHMQKQNCVTLPAVISLVPSPGPTSNMPPVIWRFWVSQLTTVMESQTPSLSLSLKGPSKVT